MDKDKAHYVVATGIVIKGGKYLITRRSNNEKAFPGKWTVPGGRLEHNDYRSRKPDTDAGHWYNVCESLIRREVFEETSLKIKNIKYLTSLSFIRPDGIPTIIISLFADYHDGEVKLCNELIDYKWITLDEAKNYDLIDGIYDELVMLDKHLNGSSLGEWKKNAS